MAVLLISLFLCKLIIPQSEFITNKKPPIKGRRLPMKAILKTNIIITQKGLSKQSFPEIPSGYVHIAYMALNSISLWNSQKIEIVCAPDPVELPTLFFLKSRFCCRYIITQKIKKPLRQSVSVHSGCRGIVVHIYIITQKKPQHNAEASTTTAMVSLLQCEGR